MSASEYLRRKAAKTQYIVNTVKPTDSSMQTLKVKHAASRIFNTLSGGSIGTTLEADDLETSKGKPARAYAKHTGRPANSSDYTAYRGSQAINTNTAASRGKIFTSGCVSNAVFPEPVTFTGGMRTANTVSTNASGVTSATATCYQTLPVAHNNGDKVVSTPQFVDNTISLNGYSQCCHPTAIHSVKAETPLNIHPPITGAKRSVPVPLGDNNVPSYKAGAATPNIPYIEKHHGNDLNVNPAQLIKTYQGSRTAVNRINVPRFGNYKP